MTRRRDVGLAAVIALVFATAPTVGDVGACGKTATDLDLGAFAASRKSEDCARCQDCGLHTQRCQRACDPHQPSDTVFPPTCHPLYHDGEVCLRALRAASCDDYASYVDDVAPTEPTECDFCRLVGDGAAP